MKKIQFIILVVITCSLGNPSISWGLEATLECSLKRTRHDESIHWPRFDSGTLKIKPDGSFEFTAKYIAFKREVAEKKSHGKYKRTTAAHVGGATISYNLLELESVVNYGVTSKQTEDFPRTLGMLYMIRQGDSWIGSLNEFNGTSLSPTGWELEEGPISATCR